MPTITTYSIACPKCGGQLSPVALDAHTAPWLCNHGCGLGFWASELDAAAIKLFDHYKNGRDSSHESQKVRDNCHAERDLAVIRGTSLREDQLAFAPTSMLQSLATLPNLDKSFLALINTQLKNTGH
jgi:hypothetical protein